MRRRPLSQAVASALVVAGLTAPLFAQAQDAPRRSASVLLEEVVITARKRDESMQDVPVAVAAFGSDQIEALKVRDLTNLAVSMPNVSLDDIGTIKGTANFMIRGLGVNSSIPSIDPTVGIFMDGVYLGLNYGVIMDTFDLERIEVLRGPQGTLFGRNVTGGAVLMNTKKPGEELEFTARVAADGNPNGDGGLNSYAMSSVGGPVTDTLGAKLTVYHNNDDGWFVNETDGDERGGIKQKSIRPTIAWNPTEELEVVLRYEYTDINADGPAAQSHTNGLGIPGTPTNYSRNDFKFANDTKGFADSTTKFLTSEVNWNVAFGEGVITNIFGWRDYDGKTLSDIDAQPVQLFNASTWLEAEQYSEELRYNGSFASKFNVTTGLYYFTNDINYHARRDLLGALTPDGSPAKTTDGGGKYTVDTYAWFNSVDYDLNEAWTLNAGLRYTYEKKKADIASSSLNVNAPCNVLDGTCPIDFSDDEDWTSWSPKVGATYALSDDAMLYGHWTLGYRSGGYNLRNTAQDTVNFGPGPFDEEKVTNYEIGYKGILLDGRAKVNTAMFYTTVDDMQREINLADPTAGVVQVIRNTADAELWGVEADGTFSLLDNLTAMASVGYTHSEYTSVKFDLNGDGVIDGQDEDLNLPRAAEWTYSLGLNLDTELGDWGYMTSRVSYAYRDDSAYTDNNLGTLNSLDMVDAGIDYHTANNQWVVSLYGRNLLDEAKHGGDTQLPAMLGPVELGGTFSPLAKGRTVGLEVTYTF
jgi:iron complex outermembrane receptor protein